MGGEGEEYYEEVGMIETVSISKAEYENFKKWSQSITLKAFVVECAKLGVLIKQDVNIKWILLYRGNEVATIDPKNEYMIRTYNAFSNLPIKDELFELLVNLACTQRKNRHLKDFFEEEDKINETI